jgi:hypothetical protein
VKLKLHSQKSPEWTSKVASVANPGEPEWLRVPAAAARFGLSRTHLFMRIGDGTLESKHIKQPGRARGIRIISVDSIRRYLATFSSEVSRS